MPVYMTMARFHREVTPDEFKALLADLRSREFRLLLTSANNAYFQALGVEQAFPFDSADVPSGQLYVNGDLVSSQDWTEVAYIALRHEFVKGARGRPKHKHYLETGCVTRSGTSGLLDQIRSVIADKLGSASAEHSSWSPRHWSNARFEELATQGKFLKPDFTQADYAASQRLAEANLRKLMTAIKISGGMLVRDFNQMAGGEGHLAPLEQVDLARKEIVLICRKTSNLMNRLPSADALKHIDEHGVVCAACGRRLADERVDELVVPTELAKRLLDHSRWMAVLLMDNLERLGVHRGNVLLEYEEGTEEIDALILMQGALLMAELKDKQFSMGHAYPLSARISMYQPEHVIVAASDRIAPEVKEFFERIEPECQLSYVESVDQLQSSLEDLANGFTCRKIATLLERFNPLTIGVDVPSLIGSKLGLALPTKRSSSWIKRLSRF